MNHLRAKLIEFMTKNELDCSELCSEIPSSYEKYSDLVIFPGSSFKSPFWATAGPEVWQLICDHLKVKRIAVKGRIQSDGFRSPTAVLLYGDSTAATFIDSGVKFTWDITKNMFCAGNVSERHRIGNLNCEGEVIVDLFAGIGYFTLPYLVRARAKFVHACEWNPDAVLALRKNLRDNKVEDRCSVYEGDCREVCPENVADKVNLGLIPSSECGWATSCAALRPSGGIIYLHQNITSKHPTAEECSVCAQIHKNLPSYSNAPSIRLVRTGSQFQSELLSSVPVKWKKPEWFDFSIHVSHIFLSLLESTKGSDWVVHVVGYHKVKSYAPHVDHLVYFLLCSPNEME